MRIVVATTNRGKLRELGALFAEHELLTRDEAGFLDEVEEDGATFEENARKKAVTVARHTGLATLADDSGLEVDALGGEPGVHSARYAGPNATDAQNNEKLLRALQNFPTERRGGRFRCVLALALPDGQVHCEHGTVEGTVAFGARGTTGFGYDPLFVPEGHIHTLGEMTLEAKLNLSHRGRAAEKMAFFLLSMTSART